MAQRTVLTHTPLERAVIALSEHCDGAAQHDQQGYNAYDAPFMNSLAEQLTCAQPKALSAKQQAIAYDRLAKYAGQLFLLGIDYTQISPPGLQGAAVRQPGQAPTWAQPTPTSGGSADPAGAALSTMAAQDRGMVARMPGVCSECGGAVSVGDRFTWGQARGARVHVQCPTRQTGPVVLTAAQLQAGQRVPPGGLQLRDGLGVDDLIGPHGWAATDLPDYESRPQQLGGARLAAQAMQERRTAIIEAGTGTGKSMMLMSAAAAIRLAGGAPAIVVTPTKALQAQYRDKDAPFLSDLLKKRGHRWVAAELKGRRNYVCLADVAEKQDDEARGEASFPSPEAAAAWPKLQEWLGTTANGDFEQATVDFPADLRLAMSRSSGECTGDKCPLKAQCWAVKARERVRHADVAIVNMALFGKHMKLMDQLGGDVRLIPIGLETAGKPTDDPEAEVTTPGSTQPIIIMDEAHKLEEAATEAFGVELRLSQWVRLQEMLDHLTVGHKQVKAAQRKLGSRKKGQLEAKGLEYGSAERMATSAAVWQDEAEYVTNMARAVWGTWQERLEKTEEGAARLGDESAVAGALFDMTDKLAQRIKDGQPSWLEGAQGEQWRKIGEGYAELALNLQNAITPTDDDNWVRYAQLEQAENRRPVLVVQAKPVDPAELLRQHLWTAYPSVVAASATIASSNGLDYWRERVGAPTHLEMIVPAPFNYASQAQLYLPADGKRLDPRGGRDLRTHDGRAYVAALSVEMYQLVDASNGGAFLLFTSRKMMRAVQQAIGSELNERWTVLVQGEAPTVELVRQFKEDGNAVLFGLKSFWEGVDIPHEALRMVAINAMPFSPPSDPVWAAKCDRVDRKLGRPGSSFKSLAIPEATIALKQGFGRLIRTSEDYGVVALLDGRLTTEWYGQQILAALPPATQVRSLQAVRGFYQANTTY